MGSVDSGRSEGGCGCHWVPGAKSVQGSSETGEESRLIGGTAGNLYDRHQQGNDTY